MGKIKIGYFADGPWSHTAFNLLIEDKDIEMGFIVPRIDSEDNTLIELANQHGIPYLKRAKINTEEFYLTAKPYKCNLFVSMSFNQIFKAKIAGLPSLGTINCHAGKLPYYRGRNILNWVLINDEIEFGITVHFVDEGIDTGDIILQKCFPITDQDNYETLLTVAYLECANTLYEAIKLIQNGDHKRIKQKDIHKVGFYCGQRRKGDELINWNQSSRQLFNFIRAIAFPGPKALTYLNYIPVMINSAALIKDAPDYISTIGQIVGKTSRGLVVKTSDNVIEIFDIDTTAKIKIGDKFDL